MPQNVGFKAMLPMLPSQGLMVFDETCWYMKREVWIRCLRFDVFVNDASLDWISLGLYLLLPGGMGPSIFDQGHLLAAADTWSLGA